LKQKFITQKHVTDLFGCTANAVLQESMKQIEALKLIGQESDDSNFKKAEYFKKTAIGEANRLK
jgi:hypothetical protein